jgi:hypothetical protein
MFQISIDHWRLFNVPGILSDREGDICPLAGKYAMFSHSIEFGILSSDHTTRDDSPEVDMKA